VPAATRPPTIDAGRERVWLSFAGHFLDTETRHDLPRSALTAVEAGFSVEEAREIWCFEVTPAVGANLWSVAGEWAGWNEDGLVSRVTAIARRRRHRPGFLAYLRYRLTIHFGHSSWLAIADLMRALYAIDPASRPQLVADLVLLGECYFDFLAPDLAPLDPARRAALRHVFHATFLPALGRTVVAGVEEGAAARAARVEKALASA